jgi:hypothetical protein
VAGLDPDTREIVRLFHPRRDSWADHFVWDGPELKARTQMGRVTIAVLVINDPEVIAVRRALQDEGVLWRSRPKPSLSSQLAYSRLMPIRYAALLVTSFVWVGKPGSLSSGHRPTHCGLPLSYRRTTMSPVPLR